MTTKKELLAKIAELQAQVSKMPDEFRIETARAYGPLERNQLYRVAYADGDVTGSGWENDSVDRRRLNTGQVFLTIEAAEREAKRRKLWQACRKAMRDAWEAFGEEPVWTDDRQVKFCLTLNRNYAEYMNSWTKYERIHFPTKKSRGEWRSTVTDDEIKLMLIEEW